MAGKVDFTAYRNPNLAVACPKCRAVVGAYCCRPSGHSGPMVPPHAERKAEADAVWLRQGDWPITQAADGRWVYAVGEAEDGQPPRPGSPAAPPPPPPPPPPKVKPTRGPGAMDDLLALAGI